MIDSFNKKKHRNYIDNSRLLFSCSSCHCHLLEQTSIISKNFQGRVSHILPKEKKV
jgi:hypothetical protein